MAALILTGCTAAGGIDTSAAGQVAYACGLSEQITAPESWDTAIGDDADPGAVAAQATISLLGGNSLYTLPDHPELTEAARELGQAFQRFDQDGFDEALDAIAEGCDGITPPAEPAFDTEGQIAYACALARSIRTEHGDPESWDSLSENPAWHGALSVASLVGAANGGTVAGAEGLGQAAGDLLRAVIQATPADVEPALAAFVEGCPS